MAGLKLINAEGKDQKDFTNQLFPVPTLAVISEGTGVTASSGPSGVSGVKTTTTTSSKSSTGGSGPTGVRILPTAVPQVPTAKPAFATNPNACIVTLFGKQYDVSQLRATHSGGDIFTCGSDMSSVYQGKHGTNVNRMQAYARTTAGSSGSTGVGGSTGSVGSSGATGTSVSVHSFEDDEDEEDEKNYIKEQSESENKDKNEEAHANED